MHYAAYQGHTEVIQALLDAGAEVNATNEAGCTPLFFAAQQEREDVVALLLEAGAEVAVPEKKVRMPCSLSPPPRLSHHLIMPTARFDCL